MRRWADDDEEEIENAAGVVTDDDALEDGEAIDLTDEPDDTPGAEKE